MRLLPHEVSRLRLAHLARPGAFRERRSLASRAGRVALSFLFVSLVCAVVLFLERKLDSSVIVGALWAAPLALMARSLAQTLVAILVVVAAFSLGPYLDHARTPSDLAVFIVSGMLVFGAASILLSRYITDKSTAQRERDVFAAGFATLMIASEQSNEVMVWLDENNTWIQCNVMALSAMGITRISHLGNVDGGAAEHDAMLGMMHSGSRDAWRRLVEIINSKREIAKEGEGPSDPLNPTSKLMASIDGENHFDTQIKFTDALGRSAWFYLRATLDESGNTLVHAKFDRPG